MKEAADLHVTLWPSMPHFGRFATDPRIKSIRLNSAMVNVDELDVELSRVHVFSTGSRAIAPLYFDIKGRQLRVTAFKEFPDHLELEINHPIRVETPVEVLLKAGSDFALLKQVVGGRKLIFEGGPTYRVKTGESLHIRHPSLRVGGPIYTDAEKVKIEKVVKAGFKRFYLSYVEGQEEIDQLREVIGKDSELILKIESVAGLRFVAKKYIPQANTRLMAARGDLYVEIARPDQILEAMKLILSKDKQAFAGSRMLLTVVKSDIPECADFAELAWIYDIGYRNFLLCDEICLKEELLGKAVNCFDAFRDAYIKERNPIDLGEARPEEVEDPWEK